MAQDEGGHSIRSYYDALREELELQAGKLSRVIPHMGEMGRNNEQYLSAFLRKALPRKYSIGTGIICSANEGLGFSRQMDIVIHDEENNAPISREHSCDIYVIEAIYATVEVKTTLRRDNFRETLKAISQVRQLAKEKRYALYGTALLDGDVNKAVSTRTEVTDNLAPRSFIFAYDVEGFSNPEALRNWMVDAIAQEETAHVHGLAVLKRDWFFSQKAFTKGEDQVAYVPGNALVNFSLSLLQSITGMLILPAVMEHYLQTRNI